MNILIPLTMELSDADLEQFFRAADAARELYLALIPNVFREKCYVIECDGNCDDECRAFRAKTDFPPGVHIPRKCYTCFLCQCEKNTFLLSLHNAVESATFADIIKIENALKEERLKFMEMINTSQTFQTTLKEPHISVSTSHRCKFCDDEFANSMMCQ